MLHHRRNRQLGIGVLAAVLAVLAACGSSTSDPTSASGPATTSASRDITGTVDIGGDRKLFVECLGKGSPTVVLIAGKGNGADEWSQILAPGDPVHDTPGDDVGAGMGALEHSDDAVLPSVAKFTRVCAYDRPDVRTGNDTSTPRAQQPHTVDQDVDDLHALLGKVGGKGPYVVVAHSYGGAIAMLYTRTYPDSVGGLVMVDAASEKIGDVVTPGALANWDATNSMTSPELHEGVRMMDAFAKINAAEPMPRIPTVVLSADKPWRVDLVPPEALQGEQVTFADWSAAQDKLAADLDAEQITETKSGHGVYLYSPQLVIDAIRAVVDDVR